MIIESDSFKLTKMDSRSTEAILNEFNAMQIFPYK